MPVSDEGFRVGWQERAAAFCWGLQFALLSPVVAMLLVNLYGATPGQVGIVLAIYNAVGFLASWAVPRWADARHDYLRPMAGCALLTVATATGLWLAPGLLAAVAVLVLLGAPSGVGNAMVFALLRARGASREQVVGVRAWFSIAWVVGPPLAAAVMARFGPRQVLLVVALVGCGSLAMSLLLRRGAQRRDEAAAAALPQQAERPTRRRAIALVAAALALLQATNTAAVSVMTLLVVHRAGLPIGWAGVALGVAAALEVPMLFAVGRLSAHLSTVTLLVAGCVAGAGYYASVAFAHTGWVLVALQLLNAAFYAVVAGVGLTWFQEVVPRPAMAAGLYSNCNRVGSIISGPLVAVAGVTALGYGGVMLASALVCLLAVALVLAGSRVARAS